MYFKQFIQTNYFQILIIFLFFTSCSAEDETALNPLSIKDSTDLIDDRLYFEQDTLAIVYYENNSGRKEDTLELIQNQVLIPPTVDGVKVQANYLFYEKDDVFVSYNLAGNSYKGAVDRLDAKKEDLKIQEQLLVNDSDINAMAVKGNDIYMAGASAQNNASSVIKVGLKGKSFDLSSAEYLALGSFAANSIIAEKNSVYVTTGSDADNGGGVYRLSENLVQEAYTALDDARWVLLGKENVFVGQGTPGRLSILHQGDLSMINQIDVPGAYIPEAKTTIAMADDLIFFAAGEGGLVIISEETGQILHQMIFPEVGSVTNAVTVDKEMIFIANGEGGLYIASYDKKNPSEKPNLVGKASFSEQISINHIIYRKDYLYVAAGIGGVRSIEVLKNNKK